jgi:hypothetical protein
MSFRSTIATLTALLAPLLSAARPTSAPAPKPAHTHSLLLAESFDDADLLKRGWYDGDRFRIVPAAFSGKGCAEYEARRQLVFSHGRRMQALHMTEETARSVEESLRQLPP